MVPFSYACLINHMFQRNYRISPVVTGTLRPSFIGASRPAGHDFDSPQKPRRLNQRGFRLAVKIAAAQPAAFRGGSIGGRSFGMSV